MLLGVKTGCAESWTRLVNVWSPVVYDWCRRFSLQPTDAKDVVQNVFLKVWEKIKTFERKKPGDSFRGWLFIITKNAATDHFRGRQGAEEAFGGTEAKIRLQNVPAPDFDSVEASSRADTEALVVHRAAQAIQNDFDPATWDAFRLCKLEGMTAAEAGKLVGKSADAVRHAVARVLKRLREELEGQL